LLSKIRVTTFLALQLNQPAPESKASLYERSKYDADSLAKRTVNRRGLARPRQPRRTAFTAPLLDRIHPRNSKARSTEFSGTCKKTGKPVRVTPNRRMPSASVCKWTQPSPICKNAHYVRALGDTSKQRFPTTGLKTTFAKVLRAVRHSRPTESIRNWTQSVRFRRDQLDLTGTPLFRPRPRTHSGRPPRDTISAAEPICSTRRSVANVRQLRVVRRD